MLSTCLNTCLEMIMSSSLVLRVCVCVCVCFIARVEQRLAIVMHCPKASNRHKLVPIYIYIYI